jgi:sugar/nucleoside kinase (ribokinase family)
MRMRGAVVAGHLCLDIVPELAAVPPSAPGDLTEIGPARLSAGGCVGNTGGDLAALGAPVTVVADVGDDALGTLLVGLLGERVASTSQVRRRPGASTSYTIVLQPSGRDRAFWHHVGANAGFDGSAIVLDSAGLLHVGYPSVLPALSAGDGDPLVALLERARRAGVTTSLDLAVLDPAAPSLVDWPRLLARVLPLVDVITPSAADVWSALGTGPEALEDTAERLVALGAAVAMVTGGGEGLALRTAGLARLRAAGELLGPAWADRADLAPALEVEVVTTRAAGDAATAGLLYGVLAGLDPGEALRLAAHTAAARVAGEPIAVAQS